MRSRRALLLVAFLVGQAQAAGFDCKSPALSPVEDMICADPQLASQDAYLSSLFSRLMRLSIEKERATLRLDQNLWLEKERNKCADAACLEKAYDTRSTKLLEQWQTHVPPGVLAEL